MINIIIEACDECCAISVRGHANYCDGNDIVCAGVSAIIQAFIGVMINSEVEHEYSLQSGECEVIFADGLACELNMLIIGLLQIEKAYPENVALTFV